VGSQKNLDEFLPPSIAIKDNAGTSVPLNNLPMSYKNSSVQVVRKRAFTATFFVSGQGVTTRLSEDRPRFREDDRQEIKRKENVKFSHTVGALFSLAVARNLSVQSGVGLVTRVTDIDMKNIFARPDNRGNVHYRISCSSGYAYVSTKGVSTLAVGDSIPSLSTATTLQYISVPLGLQYTLRDGKFSINPAIAVSANFKTRGKVETVLSTPGGNEKAGTEIEGLKSVYYDGLLRMDFGYDISKAFGFVVMPSARLGLSPITDGGPVKTYVNSLGLGVGLNVHF